MVFFTLGGSARSLCQSRILHRRHYRTVVRAWRPGLPEPGANPGPRTDEVAAIVDKATPPCVCVFCSDPNARSLVVASWERVEAVAQFPRQRVGLVGDDLADSVAERRCSHRTRATGNGWKVVGRQQMVDAPNEPGRIHRFSHDRLRIQAEPLRVIPTGVDDDRNVSPGWIRAEP
jgi:hypothetical protein